jgi:hypothetical protein
MAEYRAYLVGSDGHFYDVFPLNCADDAEAIEWLRSLLSIATLSFGSLTERLARSASSQNDALKL